ncbi:MAG: hypothetical protein OEM07_06320 [Gammaproteobacteria bacterium]|nr:hypothetical protein [Gammaproteobacteria bacterium]
MKTTLVLAAIMTVGLTGSAIAESDGKVMPPPGPYIVITDVGQYGVEQNGQNDSKGERRHVCTPAMHARHSRVAPGWQNQPQAQLGNGVNQPNRPQMQNWNNQPPQWNYNRQPAMPNAYSGQMPAYQNNRMQQPYPSARGSVYGPGVPPVDYYRQPVQQPPRY